MYNVSNEYKNQIHNPLRNASYMRILLDVADPQSKFDVEITGETQLIFSNVNDIIYKFNVIPRYPTLEQNRLILDGNAILADTGIPYSKQGYIRDGLSDVNGIWFNNPVLILDFGNKYYDFNGLTFTFDSQFHSHPKQVHVLAYKDVNIVFDSIVDVTSSVDWIFNGNISESNKIELTFIDCNMPYTFFRIENILLGTRKVFTSDIITDSTWTRNVDFINSKLPTYDFEFSILDVNKEYDPENPQGIYPYLSENQNVTFYYGYELDSGIIEWMKGGETLTTGEVKINTDSIIPVITFKTHSILATLNSIYKKGIYQSTPVTLYSLAQGVFEYANLPLNSEGQQSWYIDDSLQNYYSNAALPKKQINVLLQIIANAGMCVLRVDRTGTIRIIPEPTTVSDGILSLSDMYNPPVVNKYPPLQGVDTSLVIINVDANISTLLTKTITGAVNSEFEFEYADSTNITASVGSGLTIIGTPEFYCNSCRIILNGTGALTITGKKLIYTSQNITSENQLVGERCPIYNSLITSDDHIIKYADWIKDYASRSYDYTSNDRGFPEFDMDNIQFDSAVSNGNYGTVYYVQIKYNGTISGSTKILTANNTFRNLYDACGTIYSGQIFKLPSMPRS